MIYLFLPHDPKSIISVWKNVGKCLIICMYNILQIQCTHMHAYTCKTETHASFQMKKYQFNEDSHWYKSCTCLWCFQIPEFNKYVNQVFFNSILFFLSHWMENRTDGPEEWLLLIIASLVIESPGYLNLMQGLWEMWMTASLCDGLTGPCLYQANGCFLFNCFIFIYSANPCHFEKQNIIYMTILTDLNHRHYKCLPFKWMDDKHKTPYCILYIGTAYSENLDQMVINKGNLRSLYSSLSVVVSVYRILSL